MQKISLVLFDMHDVLCRFDQAKRLEDLARISGKSTDEIFAAIWGAGFEAEADAGKLDSVAYLKGFGERLGYPITLDEWVANRKLAMVPMPEVLAIMADVEKPGEGGGAHQQSYARARAFECFVSGAFCSVRGRRVCVGAVRRRKAEPGSVFALCGCGGRSA